MIVTTARHTNMQVHFIIHKAAIAHTLCYTSYLHIDIAERPTKRAHRIPNRNILKRTLKHRAQSQRIIQRAITTRRSVIERNSTANRISPVIEILVLPDPPRAIDLCVVEVEGLTIESARIGSKVR